MNDVETGALSETIAARSTPAGHGFRAMIRVSGSTTYEVLAACCEGILAGRRSLLPVFHTRFSLDRGAALPVCLLCFHAPRSYTGEDLAEIHLPGSPALAAAVLERIHAAGARPAQPGEFTRRAYLAGRLDLTQAEGIQALIAARDESERRGALALTGGAVGGQVEGLRQSLVDLLADMEASIDFLDHETDAAGLPRLEDRLDDLEAQLEALIRVTRDESRVSSLPRVLFWGRTNAGKSTLFNRLVGRERALTSARPGTTRDVLSGRFHTPEGDVLLHDAPGVDWAGPGDADAAAIRTASSQRASMDLHLVVADGSEPSRPPDPGPGPCLLVVAKADLEQRLDPDSWADRHRPVAVVRLSARTGAGLPALQVALGTWVRGACRAQDVVVSAGRLRALFLLGLGILDTLRSEHALGFGPECLSIHVRGMIRALEEVTGRVFTEQLLDSVFSRFCIGK